MDKTAGPQGDHKEEREARQARQSNAPPDARLENVPISNIIIGDRFRKFKGDVEELSGSIQQVGAVASSCSGEERWEQEIWFDSRREASGSVSTTRMEDGTRIYCQCQESTTGRTR